MNINKHKYQCYSIQLNCDWFEMALQAALESSFNKSVLDNHEHTDQHFDESIAICNDCLNNHSSTNLD